MQTFFIYTLYSIRIHVALYISISRVTILYYETKIGSFIITDLHDSYKLVILSHFSNVKKSLPTWYGFIHTILSNYYSKLISILKNINIKTWFYYNNKY